VKTELANKLGIVDLVKGPDGLVGWEQFHLWLQKATYQPTKRILHSGRTGPYNPEIQQANKIGKAGNWHLLNDGTVAVVKTSIQVVPSAEFAQCLYKNS
jgi:hypothetical protein